MVRNLRYEEGRMYANFTSTFMDTKGVLDFENVITN